MPRKIKNRTKKVKKQSTNNRSLFRLDARRTMRNMLTALQRVALMREECGKIKNYPADVLEKCLAEEKKILAGIETIEPTANKVIELCDPAVPMDTWEVDSMLIVTNYSMELEQTADALIAQCADTALTLQI